MHEKITEDTIAAISTPIGEGGIGIVRLSGSLALKIADSLFISKDKVRVGKFKTYTVHYGHIVDKIRNPKSPPGLSARRAGGKIRNKPKPIDEVILTVMKAPKSYTREDVVEINCHGGIQAVKKVLGLVIKNGARMADPGEFTKRAFLNGRLDLSQAESVLDVIRAKTENSLRIAMDQLGGELSGKIDKIRDNIINMASQIEASIDFPDEEPEVLDRKGLERSSGAILKELKTLIDSYNEGIIFREGVLAIICGKPNVGKSSLMNLLLKRDRVIVSSIPGTTRDAVEEMINLKGIPIRLVDTAGIGQAKDILEREGASKSKKYLELADIVIMMLDGSTKIDKADLDIIKLIKDKRKLIVINKSDLAKKIEIEKIGKLFKGEKMIGISVRERRNIKLLEDAVAGLIWRGDFSQAEGLVVSNIRHKELLDKSLESMLSVKSDLEKKVSPELVVVDLKEAINSLGLIIGKTISDDILDKIFEQFCIGK